MPEAAEHFPLTIASDAEVDAVLAEFNGDPRSAIRALLHDMSLIVRDSEVVVSHGFVRGRLLSFNLPATGKKAST